MNFKRSLQTIMVLAIMLFGSSAFAQWKINEGFEGGAIPTTWKIYDVNGDNLKWKASNKPAYAHSGDWIAFVEAYSGTGLKDILVTPQVMISQGDHLNFFARSWFGLEDLTVKISTTGNAINNFNITLAEITGIGTTYQEFTYDLSAYAGQNLYIAFNWLRDDYAMVLDDIKVGQQMPIDIGIHSIDSPLAHHLTGETIIPVAKVKNYGSSQVSQSFPVTCVITDSLNNVVYSDITNFNRTLDGGQMDTVHFQPWIPDTEGEYSISMFTSYPGDADITNDSLQAVTDIVLHYGTGGPDAMSYQWIDSSVPGGPQYNWIDISTTGQSTIMYGVDQFSGDDNISEEIPLGFDFRFYGIERNHFYVDINGTLFLADPVTFHKPYPDLYWDIDGNIFNYMYPVPGYRNMPALVSVFWDDLEAIQGTGDIYFQTFGVAPDRYTVVQWNNLKFRAGTGTQTLSFEVILHESGDIVMQYKNVATGQAGSNIPHDFGQSATIGIQNDNWSTGLGYLNEVVQNNEYMGVTPPGNLLKNEMAIKFYLGEDNQGPVITHTPVWNTFLNSAYMKAEMIDANGIAADTLYYNTGNGWNWMTHDSITGAVYHYTINDIPVGSTVDYYFVAVDGSENSNVTQLESVNSDQLSFKVLPTAGTKVIVLSPGNKPGFSDYTGAELNVYTTALESLGVSYDVYNFAAFDTFTLPDAYDIAYVYHNNAVANGVMDTLSKAMINFMELGTSGQPKNVFMAGDEVAMNQHSLSNASYYKQFMAGYMRTAYEVQPNPPVLGGTDGIGGPDIPGDAEGTIKAQANSPIGITGNEIGVFADSPDVIYARTAPDWMPEVQNPDRAPGVSYRFEDGPIDGNAYSKGKPCALWLNNDNYKAYFISFNMSTINSSEAQNMISQAYVWFTPESFNVTVSAIPEDGGNVSGGGEYILGSSATVMATANTGYDFINWKENGAVVSTSAEYTFTVTGNHSLVANFGVRMVNVTTIASPIAGGTITGSGSYAYGTTVTVTAEAAPDYQFISWTTNGNVVSTDNEVSFVVTADTTLTANFQYLLATLNVIADPVEGGIVTGGGNFQPGSEVTVTATEAEGFKFNHWEVNGQQVSTEATYSFILEESMTLTAKFTTTVSTGSVVADKIQVLPNPATDRVYINLNGQKADRIELYNSTILLKAIEDLDTDTHYFELTSLPKGILYVRVILSNGSVNTYKIIHI